MIGKYKYKTKEVFKSIYIYIYKIKEASMIIAWLGLGTTIDQGPRAIDPYKSLTCCFFFFSFFEKIHVASMITYTWTYKSFNVASILPYNRVALSDY